MVLTQGWGDTALKAQHPPPPSPSGWLRSFVSHAEQNQGTRCRLSCPPPSAQLIRSGSTRLPAYLG